MAGEPVRAGIPQDCSTGPWHENCAAEGDDHGWTSGSPWAQGAKGDVNTTESWWTDGVTGLCSEPAERIYCIEQ